MGNGKFPLAFNKLPPVSVVRIEDFDLGLTYHSRRMAVGSCQRNPQELTRLGRHVR
jgi:hypothetical protein